MELAVGEWAAVTIWAALVVVPLAGFVDGLRFADATWEASGHHKVAWLLALALFGLFCGVIGTGLGIYYWYGVSRGLRAAGPQRR